MFPTVAHRWAKCIDAQGEYFKSDFLSVSCKYTGMRLAIK